MLGDRADAVLCMIIGLIMAGACHSVSTVPGQTVYVVLSAAISLLAILLGIDLWRGAPMLLRIVRPKH